MGRPDVRSIAPAISSVDLDVDPSSQKDVDALVDEMNRSFKDLLARLQQQTPPDESGSA